MLPGFVTQPVPGLDVSELLGQPLAWRAASQSAELPGQVGLVEVTAVGGQVREQVITAGGQLAHQQLPGPVEPDDAGGGLRRQPDLGAEPAGQVPLAPAGPGGQLGHPDRAALPQQLVPGPADLWCYTGVSGPAKSSTVKASTAKASTAEQDLVQHREPLGPAGRGP